MAKKKSNDWAWVNKTKPKKNVNKTIPAAWYSSKDWMATRDRKLSHTPFCEVSDHLGRIHYRNLHIDHVIPIEMGGAPFHPYNLMTMNSTFHGKKTKLESIKGSPLIDFRETESGRVPTRRSDIFQAIFAAPKRNGHNCEIVW